MSTANGGTTLERIWCSEVILELARFLNLQFILIHYFQIFRSHTHISFTVMFFQFQFHLLSVVSMSYSTCKNMFNDCIIVQYFISPLSKTSCTNLLYVFLCFFLVVVHVVCCLCTLIFYFLTFFNFFLLMRIILLVQYF